MRHYRDHAIYDWILLLSWWPLTEFYFFIQNITKELFPVRAQTAHVQEAHWYRQIMVTEQRQWKWHEIAFFRLKQNYDAPIWIYATQFEIHRGKKTTSLVYKRAWWWSFERLRLITYIILWHHLLLNGPWHGQRTAHRLPTAHRRQPTHHSVSL